MSTTPATPAKAESAPPAAAKPLRKAAQPLVSETAADSNGNLSLSGLPPGQKVLVVLVGGKQAVVTPCGSAIVANGLRHSVQVAWTEKTSPSEE